MEQTIIDKEDKISKVLLNNKNLEEHINDEKSKITSKNKIASRLQLLQQLIIEQYDIDYVFFSILEEIICEQTIQNVAIEVLKVYEDKSIKKIFELDTEKRLEKMTLFDMYENIDDFKYISNLAKDAETDIFLLYPKFYSIIDNISSNIVDIVNSVNNRLESYIQNRPKYDTEEDRHTHHQYYY